MPARESYHVVAIDFSPHTESMQTDALLRTKARSAAGIPVFDSGPKNMCLLIACVCVIVIIVIAASNA